MAKVGRNDPCPCGSKKKAKRCCYSSEHLAAEAEVRKVFRELCISAADDLEGTERADFYDLFHRAIHLPEIDLSLQVRLPKVFSPEIERARRLLEDDDEGAFDDALFEVARQLDNPHRRLELAQAIVTLKDAGKIDPKVAAAAVFDLSDGDSSAVFISSVAEAIGVSAGESRTPAGLLVAVA